MSNYFNSLNESEKKSQLSMCRFMNINEFDNKNNIVVNQEEFDKRFDKLVEKIDYYLENGSEKDIECIKLFYDT